MAATVPLLYKTGERHIVQALRNLAREQRIGRSYLLQISIVFIAYLVAGKLGQATANIRSSNLGPVWPAYGIAVAAILICGYRAWLGVAAAAFCVAFFSPVSHIAALGQAVGATLAAMTGAFLLHRIANFRPSLARLSDALSLIVLGGISSAIVSASIGVCVLYATHVQAYSGLGAAWLIYWLGDATGVLLVTPLALRFTDLLRLRHRVVELVVLLLLLAATCLFIFSDLPFMPLKLHVMAFAVLPFIMWAAIRFGVGVTALSIVIVAAIATIETALGTGPFTSNTTFVNAVLLDVFFGVLSVSGLSLAAVISERENAEREREQVVRKQAAMEERLRAGEALRESEERLRMAAKAGKMYAYEWDAKTDAVTRSEEYANILGLSDQAVQLTRQELAAMIHPDDRGPFIASVNQLTPDNPTAQVCYRVLRPDGAVIWLEQSGRAFFDSRARLLRMIGMVSDITERKLSEQNLRESEARERAKGKELEAILEAVPIPVLIAYEKDCGHIKGNRAAQEQLHVPANRNFSQSASSGDRPTFWQMQDGVEIPADLLPMQQAAATGKPIYGRLMTAVLPDGTRREELANAVPLLDDEGRPRGAVGTSVDLTELRQTEQARRESEEKLRLILDSTAEAIYGIDLERRCTFCNPACLRTLGYERLDQVLGKDMHNLIHHTRADGTSFPVEQCGVHSLTTGEGVHAEDEIFWRGSGKSFPAEYWSYPQRRGQEIVGAVVAFVDITERKVAQAAVADVSRKLLEAQEKERIRIGRELHDDINQRLAMLSLDIERLQDNPSEIRSGLQQLRKQTTEISNDVQALSHDLHSSKLEYLGALRGMKSWCKEFGERQEIQIEFKNSEMQSSVAPEIGLCLFRVLQEALHNAAKHSGVKRIDVQLREESGEIHLIVCDLGKGFDFKAAMQGRGLGLTSMQERVRLVNGMIEIQSKPMAGTTVHVRVPLRSELSHEWAEG